jgi:hypothetical protein
MYWARLESCAIYQRINCSLRNYGVLFHAAYGQWTFVEQLYLQNSAAGYDQEFKGDVLIAHMGATPGWHGVCQNRKLAERKQKESKGKPF